ncbi:MAG TPA: hypothetical protein VN517_17145 [Terriglobales bacterium]|nr:hypothetical protein [Terriglobales bacterium]
MSPSRIGFIRSLEISSFQEPTQKVVLVLRVGEDVTYRLAGIDNSGANFNYARLQLIGFGAPLPRLLAYF